MRAKTTLPIEERVRREELHGATILRTNESNWGWHTAAGRIRRNRRAEFLAGAENGREPGTRALEVGCGTGTFTGDLSRAYPDLTSIDVSEVLLADATKKHPSVQFEKQDIHRTKFGNSTFEVVVGCSVLHHLEWDLALREIHRILKPGGQIRFSEPNLLNPQIFLQKKWPWLKRRMGDSPDESAFTAAQIRRSLTEAGYVDIRVVPFEFLHPSTPPFLIATLLRVEAVLERTPLVNLGGSMKISARRP